MTEMYSVDDPEVPAGFDRHSAEVNGTSLSYLIGGSGPPLLLLHGWPQTSLAWRPILASLASSGYTVIAPDIRGAGQSERAGTGYDKDTQAEDMRALLKHVGLQPDVCVVGHDLGGMVGFSYARQYPDEVVNLTMIELAVPGFGLEKAMDVGNGGRWHFGLFMTPGYPEMLLDGHEDEFFARWFAELATNHDVFPPQEIRRISNAYRGRESLRCGFEHYRTLHTDAAINRQWFAAGNTLSMPVLAVGGAHAAGRTPADGVCPAAPGVQTAIIPGSGHFVPEEQPAELLRVLLPFLHSPG